MPYLTRVAAIGLLLLATSASAEKHLVAGLTKDQLAQFNVEVGTAVSNGEKWPCSPMLATYELLGFHANELAEGRDVFCRGSEGDSVAVVAVRGEAVGWAGGSQWHEFNYRKLDDNTWRLTDVDSLPSQPVTQAKKLQSMLASSPFADNGRVIQRSDIGYLNYRHAERNYSRTGAGLEVALVGIASFPYGCTQSDSTVPLALQCMTPHSAATAEFIMLSESDLSLQLFGEGDKELGVFGFQGVAAGPYVVAVKNAEVPVANYRVQFWYNGKPVSRPVPFYQGPK